MTNFIPIGGFPPIIKIEPKIEQKTLESRGFQTKNIVSIGDIMKNKKKRRTIHGIW
jgi:hypothetical protein